MSYRVPLLSEIPTPEPTAPKVVSFFAGCGGSSLGYRMAGCRVIYANEFVELATRTYKKNCPDYTIIDSRNVRSIEPESVLQQINLQPGELDILDGSPPCSSFSTAGKREKGWGKVKQYGASKKQRTDDLFFEYIRMVDGIKPKVFVAENVSGLVKGTSKGYFLEIFEKLKALGYQVSCRLLDGSRLGVPQKRVRIIFVGVRNDLGKQPVHPKPFQTIVTVKDAIPWIGNPQANPFPVEPETDISRYAIAKEYDKMGRPGTTSSKYFQLIRPALNEPCGSLVFAAGSKSSAGIVHPLEKRRFSIAEMKRLSGFPDDFAIDGNYVEQWERISRAVPPLMMREVAKAIRQEVLW
jgi:DNA (cytosine-5)-methyltransferase 1